MRLLWFTDAHVSDVPPIMRREGYTEDILAKIEEIAKLCDTEKVDFAVFGGDWFNSKIAARVSHNLVNASLRVLDKFPCPVFFIVGSHDVPYGRLDLLYKRPIGTLLRHPNVIYLEDLYVVASSAPVVRLFPVSDAYNNTTEQVQEAIVNMRLSRPETDKAFDIAVLHQPVVREGSFPYPVIQSSDLVGYADLVLYGHMHNYDGVWSQGLSGAEVPTTFVNVGAVSRGSLDEKTLARVPMVAVIDVLNIDDVPGCTVREIKLKSAKPAKEVFRLAEKQEQLNREADIEALLLSVKATQFGAFSTQAAIERIKSLSYAKREDLLPEEHEFSEAHFEAVKVTAVELLEELGA